mgnify:CR=1 FL=1
MQSKGSWKVRSADSSGESEPGDDEVCVKDVGENGNRGGSKEQGRSQEARKSSGSCFPALVQTEIVPNY